MKSPFKFLDSFTKEDREIFFGREKEIEELYQRVFRSKIMLVYGISGTGKSSLINCGLANKFHEEDWLPVNIRRGKNILESMYSAIVDASNTAKLPYSASEIQFKKYVKSLYLDHYKPIYLIFDQFEELFIFGTREEKSLFARVVKTLIDSEIQCRLIFVMREEYIGSVSEFEKLIPDFFSNRIRIENMNHTNALQAINGPCNVFDIDIEEGFPEALIETLSPGSIDIELTYLQVYLDKVYRLGLEGVKTENDEKLKISLSLDLLRKVGNVSDLLGSFLNDQIALLADPDTALAVLKSFVSVKGTKRQMTLDDVKEYAQTLGKPIYDSVLLEMLQTFVNLRILKDKDQYERYELRHDSLATKIYEKISIVEKDILEIRQFIEDGYHNYNKRGVLLSASDLDYIAPYESRLFLSHELQNLIVQSKSLLGQVKKKRRIVFIAGTTGLLIVFACFTVWALIERNISKQQETVARGNYYNALAKELVNSDPTKALRIAEYACEIDPSENNYQNLVNIYSDNEFYSNYLPTALNNITNFKVLNKSGDIAIVENNKIRILNSKGEIIRESNFNLPQNFSFNISPDDKSYLIYTLDTIKIYDESFNLKARFFHDFTYIESAYFTYDSKVLIHSYDRNTERMNIILWSMDGSFKKSDKSFRYGYIINSFLSDTILLVNESKEFFKWIPDGNKLVKINLRISDPEYLNYGQYIPKNKVAFLSNFDTIRICNLEGSIEKAWYAGDDDNRGFRGLYFLNDINLLCAYNGKSLKLWDLNGQNLASLKLRSSTDLNYNYCHLTGELYFILDGQLNYYKPVNLNDELILSIENKDCQFYTHDNCFIEYSRTNKQHSLITLNGDKVERMRMIFDDDKFFYKIPGCRSVFTRFPEKHDFKIDDQILIYNILDRKKVVTLTDRTEPPISIFCSNDDELFVTAGRRTYPDSSGSYRVYSSPIQVYDRRGFVLKNFPAGQTSYPFSQIKFTSDNKEILFTNRYNAILQDTSGRRVSEFTGHTGTIHSCDLSYDDNYVLTGSFDKTARLWKRNGEILKIIETDNSFFSLSFLQGDLAFQIYDANSVSLFNIDGILMQKIQTSDLAIYAAGSRFLFFIENDGIHRSKLKQPVDSFILSNNHNDMSFREKMEYNIVTSKGLLKSKNPYYIYLAGKYYLDNMSKKTDINEKKSMLKTAEKLFQKGLTFDTLHCLTAQRLTDLMIQKNQFIKGNILEEIDKYYNIMIESNSREDLLSALDYYGIITYTGGLDSTRISYGYIERVITLSKKLMETFPEDNVVRQSISSRCSDLSFVLLDFKQFENSLIAVKIALEADSTNQYSYTNLPLAYLFNNLIDKAIIEYIKWMDKPWTATNEYKTYRGVFLEDLRDLESRGITHPDFEKVKKLLKK